MGLFRASQEKYKVTNFVGWAVFCLFAVVAQGRELRPPTEGRVPGTGLHTRPEVKWFESKPGELTPERQTWNAQRTHLERWHASLRAETSQYEALFLKSLPETEGTKARTDLNNFDAQIGTKISEGKLSEAVVLMNQRDAVLTGVQEKYNQAQAAKKQAGILYAESSNGRKVWFLASSLPQGSVAEIKPGEAATPRHEIFGREAAQRFQPNLDALGPLAEKAIATINEKIPYVDLKQDLVAWWNLQKAKSPNAAGHAYTLLSQLSEIALMKGTNGEKLAEIIQSLLEMKAEGNDFFTLSKYLENGETPRGKRVISAMGRMAAMRKKLLYTLLNNEYDTAYAPTPELLNRIALLPKNSPERLALESRMNSLNRLESLSIDKRAELEARVGDRLYEWLGSGESFRQMLGGHREGEKYIRPSLLASESGEPGGKLGSHKADQALFEAWATSKDMNQFVGKLIDLATNGKKGPNGEVLISANDFAGLKKLRGIDSSTPEGREALRKALLEIAKENEAVREVICRNCPGAMDLKACPVNLGLAA